MNRRMLKYKHVGPRTKGKNKKKTEYHGMYGSPTHSTYTAMVARCERPANIGYANYGGRGIKVCERWRQSFLAFVEDMGLRPPNYSLDRIDSDGDYEPGNCRWSDKKTQRHNSRQRLNLMTIDGETLCLSDWSIKLGIRENTIRWRLAQGWPIEKALSTSRFLNNGKERA